MACNRWLELRCDECEGDAFGGLRPQITANDLRLEARMKGWKFRSGRDICADCAALDDHAGKAVSK